jgi:hypothetical protein
MSSIRERIKIAKEKKDKYEKRTSRTISEIQKTLDAGEKGLKITMKHLKK